MCRSSRRPGPPPPPRAACGHANSLRCHSASFTSPARRLGRAGAQPRGCCRVVTGRPTACSPASTPHSQGELCNQTRPRSSGESGGVLPVLQLPRVRTVASPPGRAVQRARDAARGPSATRKARPSPPSRLLRPLAHTWEGPLRPEQRGGVSWGWLFRQRIPP